MPSNRPSSSKATALTSRPSSRASRTRSVRYSSPVAGDGVERLDPAAQPGGIEGVQPGVDLVARQLVGGRVAAPRRSARPCRTRRGRPGRARPGRRRRRWRARSRRRPRGAPRGSRRGPRRSPAGRRPTARGPRCAVAGTTASAAATASPVPRGSSWSANTAAIGEGIGDRRDRRREDDDRPAADGGRLRGRPGVERRRPASAGRTAGGGPWGPPSASACRGRPPARRRPCRMAARDLGVHEGRRRRARVAERWSLPTPAGPGARVSGVITGSGHRRGGPSGVSTEREAMTSISTRAPFGSAATPTVERAGGGSGDRPAVDRVDRREVGHVHEEDRRLDDVAPGARRPRRGPPPMFAHDPLGLGLRCRRRRARPSPDRAPPGPRRTGSRRLTIPWLYGPIARRGAGGRDRRDGSWFASPCWLCRDDRRRGDERLGRAWSGDRPRRAGPSRTVSAAVAASAPEG